jgi:hypothetical protein
MSAIATAAAAGEDWRSSMTGCRSRAKHQPAPTPSKPASVRHSTAPPKSPPFQAAIGRSRSGSGSATGFGHRAAGAPAAFPAASGPRQNFQVLFLLGSVLCLVLLLCRSC